MKLRNRKHIIHLQKNLKSIFPQNSVVSSNHSPEQKKIYSNRRSIEASINIEETKRQRSSAQIRRRIRTLNAEEPFSR